MGESASKTGREAKRRMTPVLLIGLAIAAVLGVNLIALRGGFFRALGDAPTGFWVAPVEEYWLRNPVPPPDATAREAALIETLRTARAVRMKELDREKGLRELAELAREGHARPVADLAFACVLSSTGAVTERGLRPLERERLLFHLERACREDPENGLVHLQLAAELAGAYGRACEGEILQELERAASAPRFTDYAREVSAAVERAERDKWLPRFFKRFESVALPAHVAVSNLSNIRKCAALVRTEAHEAEFAGDAERARRMLGAARAAFGRQVDAAYTLIEQLIGVAVLAQTAEAERRVILRQEGETDEVRRLGALLARANLLSIKAAVLGGNADWVNALRATRALGWLAWWLLMTLVVLAGFAVTAILAWVWRERPSSQGAWKWPQVWAVLAVLGILGVFSMALAARVVQPLVVPLVVLIPIIEAAFRWRRGEKVLPRPTTFLVELAAMLCIFPIGAHAYTRSSAIVERAYALPATDRVRMGLSQEEVDKKLDEFLTSIEQGTPRYPDLGPGILQEPYWHASIPFEEHTRIYSEWRASTLDPAEARQRFQNGLMSAMEYRLVTPNRRLPEDRSENVLGSLGTSRAHKCLVKLLSATRGFDTTSPYLARLALEKVREGDDWGSYLQRIAWAGLREAVPSLVQQLDVARGERADFEAGRDWRRGKRRGRGHEQMIQRPVEIAAALYMLGERGPFAREMAEWLARKSKPSFWALPVEILCACPTPEIERIAVEVVRTKPEKVFSLREGKLPRIKSPELAAGLVELYVDGKVEFDFLAGCIDRGAAPALIAALDELDPGRRAAEILALLGRLGDGSAVPAVERFLGDPDPETRACAHVALARLLPERRDVLHKSCALREDEFSSVAAEILGEEPYRP